MFKGHATCHRVKLSAILMGKRRIYIRKEKEEWEILCIQVPLLFFKRYRQISKIQVSVIASVCLALTVERNFTAVGQEADSVPPTIKHHCLLFSEDYIFNMHCTTTGNTSLTLSLDNHSVMVFKFT